VFLVANLVSAERWPTVWQDEVMNADPGVNLALEGHFTSSSWELQSSDELWAARPPGYQLLVAGSVSLFGFNITAVRAVNYVLMVLVALGLLLLFRRLSSSTGGLDILFLLVVLCGAGVTVDFRTVRPETLAMAIVLIIVLAAVFVSSRHRLILIAVAAALAPLTGLQTVAYLAVICCVWLALMGKHFAEVIAIGAGLGAGLIALICFYVGTGTLGVFVEYVREHYKDGAVPLINIYSSDRSLVPALIAAALLYVVARDHISVERSHLARTLIIAGVATPLALAIVGKFPITYAWMAYFPIVLGAMILANEISWPKLGRTRQVTIAAAAGLLALASAIGFPARMVFTALEWQARSYAAVEDFIVRQIGPGDVAFADFAAYYPIRRTARKAYFGKYIGVMRPEEKAALTVLVLDRVTADWTTTRVGGSWKEVASFRVNPDSLPRRIGIGPPASYDIVVMRRFS